MSADLNLSFCAIFACFNHDQLVYLRVTFWIFSPGCCLAVSTSTIHCLHWLVSKMIYYVSSGMLNGLHPLTYA